MNYKRLTATAMIVLLWLEIWQRKSFGMKPNYIKTKRTQATEYIMEIAQNLKRRFHLYRILAKLKRKVALHTGGMGKINLKYLIATNVLRIRAVFSMASYTLLAPVRINY